MEEKASVEKPTKYSGNLSIDFSRPWIRRYRSNFWHLIHQDIILTALKYLSATSAMLQLQGFIIISLVIQIKCTFTLAWTKKDMKGSIMTVPTSTTHKGKHNYFL